MRTRSASTTLTALLAGICCLALPVLSSGAWSGYRDAQRPTLAPTPILTQAEAGHDSCFTAEVDEHKRHDDRRFESQHGLRHHLHAAVAWSGAFSVGPPAPSFDATLPRLDSASIAADDVALRALERSPRQSRAPPRA